MNSQIKTVMSDKFTFVPEKAGREVYVSLGLLALIAVVLMVANTRIEGEFDIWWVIFPAILAGGLGIMLPQIRYQQRVSKYKEYLREQSREALNEALESELDEKSREVIKQVLTEPKT